MNIFDDYLRNLEEEKIKDIRLNEQRDNEDYSYLEDEIEKCDKCKSFINSHGHCPLCDY